MSGPGLGIYIHWPYCARLCPYCDFNIYKERAEEGGALLDALCADIKAHADKVGRRRVDTIFFGGGTPSRMGAGAVGRLIATVAQGFALSGDAEITLEANPDERESFPDFVAAGINRLSIGVQSLRDPDLKSLGRTHGVDAGIAAVHRAAATGARVSFDLIYARAGQSLNAWELELAQALALPGEHLSLYELTIEPGTAFARALARGALAQPDLESAVRFYELTQDMTAAAGAPAYEISNYARSGPAQARHNLNYWRGGEWLGIGPGAHGRIALDGVRVATLAARKPLDYVRAVGARGVGWTAPEIHDPATHGAEMVLMGLRLAEGLDRARIEALRGPLDEGALQTFAAEGLLHANPARVTLTPRGRLLADRIAAELSL